MQKVIKILIGIVLTLSIICIMCMIYLKTLGNKENNDNNQELISEVQDPLSPDGNSTATYEIEEVKNATRYYTAKSCIQSFINDVNQNNLQAIYDILSSQYLESKGINSSNIGEFMVSYIGDSVTLEKMETLGGERIVQYRAYGVIQNNEEKQDVYFKVIMDTDNLTFSITPYEECKSLDEIELVETNTEIKENSNNTFTYDEVNKEEMSRRYLEYYYNLELNNQNKAYSLIDEEYKKERFDSLESYIDYANSNKKTFTDAILTGYAVEDNDEYTQYVIRDSYENYYIIKEEAIMNFTIMLDTYTLRGDDYAQSYNKLSESEKASADVQLFIQMINNRDYQHAYNVLPSGFKENYFQTLESFKEYISNNYYYYNIATISSTKNEGNIYIYTVTIKNGGSTAAETKDVGFNVKLGQDTDFEISFNV